MSSSVSHGYWIDDFSDEYNIIYSNIVAYLENQLYIKRLSVWKIDNPLLRAQFEQVNGTEVVIQSWLNSNDVFQGTEDEILRSVHGGFAFPEGGMVFSAGILDGIDSPRKQKNFNPDFNPEKQYGFIMCDVAVGKSYVITNEDSVSPATAFSKHHGNIPKNYDSLYLINENSQNKNT